MAKVEYVIPPEREEFCKQIGFAEGVKAGNMLYIAGQVGWDENSKVVPGGILEQTRQAFKNMKSVIDKAGGSMDNIVQLMIFVADKGSGKPLMEDLNAFFEVKKEFFPKAMPCGTGVRVKELALPELLIEIQAIVAL
jgi:2-iminobutanoate/2-iminopropanoate deaminase